MIRWKINLLAFALIATTSCPVHSNENETQGDSKESAIISHACATPLQPAKAQLAAYAPTYEPKYSPIQASKPNRATPITPAISLATPPADLSATRSAAPDNKPQLPGLNIQSDRLNSGQSSSVIANQPSSSKQKTEEREAHDDNHKPDPIKCPLGIELECDVLCPLTKDQLKQPQPHHLEAVASNKIPERNPQSSPSIESIAKSAASTASQQAPTPRQQASAVSQEVASESAATSAIGWDFGSLSKTDTAAAEAEVDADAEVLKPSAYNSGDLINFSDEQPLQIAQEEQVRTGEIVAKFADELGMQPTSTAQTPTHQQPGLTDEISQDQSGGLIIHPPMIQPYNKNQHTFIVENRSDIMASDVTVEIGVPKNSRIIATLPANSVFANDKAVFRFEKLAAGDQVQIHINAVSKDSKPIEFVADLVSRSVFEFAIEDQANQGQLSSVSYKNNIDEPATNQPRTAQNLDDGAQRIRNPYVKPYGTSTFR